MYFQNLESLKNRISISILVEFDAWLGTMAPLYWDKINASDYALKKKLNLNTAIDLFDLAVEKEVLRPKIVLVDDLGTPHGTFYSYDEIPLTITNYEYDLKFDVNDRNKEILYELIDPPKEKAAPDNSSIRNNYESKEHVTLERLKKTGAAATLDALGADF